MKPLLLAVALLGASFSGLTLNAKAGGKPGVGTTGSGAGCRPRLVADYQSKGEEIPSKTSRIVSLQAATVGGVMP